MTDPTTAKPTPDGLAFWAPSIPIRQDGSPVRLDAGPRERSLSRLVAIALNARGRRTVPVLPTLKTQHGMVWVASGSAWALDQALKSPEVPGCRYVAWGRADLSAPQPSAWRVELWVADRQRGVQLAYAWFRGEDAAEGSAVRSLIHSILPPIWKAVIGEDSLGQAEIDALFANLMGEARPTDERAVAMLEGLDVLDSITKGVRLVDPKKALEVFRLARGTQPAQGPLGRLELEAALRGALAGALPLDLCRQAVADLLQSAPDLTRGRAAAAELALRAGDAPSAIELATPVARLAEPREAAIGEELLGRAYEATKEISQAAAAFRRALQHDPRRSVSWTYLGYFAAQLGKWDEAEVCYTQAAALAPQDASLQEALKRVRGELMKVREARGPLVPPPAESA